MWALSEIVDGTRFCSNLNGAAHRDESSISAQFLPTGTDANQRVILSVVSVAALSWQRFVHEASCSPDERAADGSEFHSKPNAIRTGRIVVSRKRIAHNSTVYKITILVQPI